MQYYVAPVVCDFGVYESGTNNLVCICNLKGNAELIADVLRADGLEEIAYGYSVYPNAKYKIVKAESEDK